MIHFKSADYCGTRLSWFAGNGQCEDDPRGREVTVTVTFEFGVPTGEFDPPRYVYIKQRSKMWGGHDGPLLNVPHLNPEYREYGSWGLGIHVWRWTLRLSIRGPVLGKWPVREDDE